MHRSASFMVRVALFFFILEVVRWFSVDVLFSAFMVGVVVPGIGHVFPFLSHSSSQRFAMSWRLAPRCRIQAMTTSYLSRQMDVSFLSRCPIPRSRVEFGGSLRTSKVLMCERGSDEAFHKAS